MSRYAHVISNPCCDPRFDRRLLPVGVVRSFSGSSPVAILSCQAGNVEPIEGGCASGRGGEDRPVAGDAL